MVKYTEEQKSIIRNKDKRVEVLACPGSGKTTVLIGKVRKLIGRGISPKKILIVSFSNKAVENIKEKLNSNSVAIRTFHAYANGIIKKRYKDLGYKQLPDVIINEAESIQLMNEAMEAKPKTIKLLSKRINGLDAKAMLAEYSHYQYKQLQLQSSNQTKPNRNASKDVLNSKMEKIFKCYKKIKIKKSKIDYVDMMPMAKKLIGNQQEDIDFEYLFVDEVQDMSASQLSFLFVLSEKIPNLMTFGDPNQAIYGFNGAANMDLSSMMTNVKSLKLTRSHRLPQPIADFAASLMNTETTKIVGYSSDIKPKLCKFPAAKGRGIYPKLLKDIYTNAGSNASVTIAVLARTKAQLREIDAAILNRGYNSVRGYIDGDVNHVFKLLKLLDKLTSRIGKEPRTNNGKVRFERLIAKSLEFPYNKEQRRTFTDCRKLALNLMSNKNLEGKYILAKNIYLKLLRVNGEPVKDVKSELERWEPISRDFSNTSDFIEHIDLIHTKPEVCLSTIHAAKGGEWDYVIVAGLVEGGIPFYKSITQEQVDEERRLLYVAATRAKKELFLVQERYKTHDKKSSFLTADVEKFVECMPKVNSGVIS